MKKFLTYCFLFIAAPAFSQYYLRGEIKDEKGKPLSDARIFAHSIRAYYYSGSPSGSFGIVEKVLYDSLTIYLEGYESLTVRVKTNEWQHIILKITKEAITKNQPKLISFTKDFQQASKDKWYTGDETYFQLVENEYIQAKQFPSTGFSLNVNKASYSNVRRFLNMNSLVPPDAVRTEELINYFNLHYTEPQHDSLFNFNSQLTSCPWDSKKELLYLNVNAKKINLEKIPPGNFVFLIDVSGSMDMPNRLPLLKAAFQMFVKNIRPVDTISIVTYGGYVQIWLRPTSGSEKDKILTAIESLEADGDTPGESAIRVAYQLARRSFIKEGNNRIILATDGDFNVGETSEKALDDLISKQKSSGVYLTCLGVGMGNLKDSKLQVLAKKGNGNYAYLDDIQEAERVLVKELTQTFYSVADDVSMNVKFNPDLVKEYRLIGFDNKKEALKDTANSLDGGEIGSGSSVLALFEILPNSNINHGSNDVIAQIDLRYRTDSIIKHHQYFSMSNYKPIDSIDRELKFAAGVAMFALKLKQSIFFTNPSWSFIRDFSTAAIDQKNYLQKQFIMLLSKAQKLYGNKNKYYRRRLAITH